MTELPAWLAGFPWRKLIDPSSDLGALLLGGVILLLAFLVSRVLGRVMLRSQWVMGQLGRQVDETVVRYALRIKTVLIYLAAGLVYASLVPGLRALMGTVVAGAGITALVMGFAAKSTLGNLVSGLSLAIYRPFRIGDTVTIEDEYGEIEDITLRHTILRAWDHKRLVIPNEKLDSMTIVNYSLVDPKALLKVEFAVSYDSDPETARRLILEEAGGIPGLLPPGKAPSPPVVRVVELGDSGVTLRFLAWVPDMGTYWSVKWRLLEAVKRRFDAEGVEIPFPYRTLVFKKDLPRPRTEPRAAAEAPALPAADPAPPPAALPKADPPATPSAWGRLLHHLRPPRRR